MATKICRICGKEKDEEEFYMGKSKQKGGDKVYLHRRTECRVCTDKRTRKYHQKNRYVTIYSNCMKAAKHRGIKCDLTREDVKNLISKPCEYCGEDDLKEIGLDRVDNSKGHTKDNVVPCCIRCNALKRDMPIKAWRFLIPKIREAHELGLFEGWLPHNRGSTKRNPKIPRGPKPPDRRFRANRT